jgi:hypothetical protein
METRSDFRFRLVSRLFLVCFGIGAFNHARDFLTYGWRPYIWAPTILEIFWTSLILLDLLVIALHFSQFKRSGLLLAAAVMIADVIANTYALVVLKIAAFGVAVPLQATFLGFILGSVPFIWPRKAGQSNHWQ